MKENTKNFILVGIIGLIGIFVFPFISHAESILYSNSPYDSCSNTNQSFETAIGVQNSGVLTDIDLGWTVAPPVNTYFRIWEKVGGATTTLVGYTTTTIGLSGASYSAPLAGNMYRFPLENAVNVSQNKEYLLEGINDGTNQHLSCVTGGKAMYFYDDGNTSVSSSDLVLIYPENTLGKFIHDFSHWRYKYNASESVDINFSVLWGTSSTTWAHQDDSQIYSLSVAGESSWMYFTLAKLDKLATSTIYYAKVCANEWDADGNISGFLGCSSVSSFRTGASTQVINTEPLDSQGVITTSTLPTLGCGDIYFDGILSGWKTVPESSTTLQILGCHAWNLIVGDSQTIEFLNPSFTRIQQLFPFNVFYGITDTFKNVLSTSTPASTLDSSYNLPNGISGTLLTTSTLRNILITDNCDLNCANTKKDNIFSVLSSTIWVLAAISMIAILVI